MTGTHDLIFATATEIWLMRLQFGVILEDFASYRRENFDGRQVGFLLLVYSDCTQWDASFTPNTPIVQVILCYVSFGRGPAGIACVHRTPRTDTNGDLVLVTLLQNLICSSPLAALGEFNIPEINWVDENAP